MHLQIWHNPGCSKSKKWLQILEQHGQPFQIFEYLKKPLDAEQLCTVLHQLDYTAVQLLRKTDTLFKEQ